MLMGAASPAPEPVPTTVNGIEMGKPEDFSLSGPGRVCLNLSAYDLLAGETAYVDYLGIHHGQPRIIGPKGQVDIGEGRYYTELKRGRAAARSPDRSIVRYDKGGERRFVLFARTAWSEGKLDPIVRVQGSAIKSVADANLVIERISVLGKDYSRCTRRFGYGWSMFEPEEAKEKDKAPQ
jgi:hypothetical protein